MEVNNMKKLIFILAIFITSIHADYSPTQTNPDRTPPFAKKPDVIAIMAAKCPSCECIEGTDCAAYCNRCIGKTVPATN